MTDTQHTPGPWTVAEDDINGQAIVRGEHSEIATCWHHCLGSLEIQMRANARLISKSPEMFDLLVDAVTNLDAAELGRFNVTTNDERKWREKAVALIAKVRGTQ